MNKNDNTKNILCTLAKIIAFLIFLNLVGFMIGKGIQRAMKLSKKIKKEALHKKDHECQCHEDEDCPCEDEIEIDDGCDGYCCEEEEDTEAVVPDITSNCTCREGEGCTCGDHIVKEEKKPE